MMDCIFYETFHEEEKLLKKYLPEYINVEFMHQTIQETVHLLPPAKIICIRTQSVIPVDWATKVDAIFSRSQGFDHLEKYLNEAKYNLPVGYLDNYCAVAVSEHAILCMFALMKKFKKQLKQFEYFNRDNITGKQIRGKNALIFGVGVLGDQIACDVKMFGMNVKGVDIICDKEYIDYIQIKEGIAWADVVFVSASLTESSRNLLGYELFRSSERSPLVINISRGEITPIKDMLRLLAEEKISGLALDVYDDEQNLSTLLRTQSVRHSQYAQDILALKQRDNVIFTPHNAFNTNEAIEEKSKKTVESILHFLKYKRFLNTVSL